MEAEPTDSSSETGGRPKWTFVWSSMPFHVLIADVLGATYPEILSRMVRLRTPDFRNWRIDGTWADS